MEPSNDLNDAHISSLITTSITDMVRQEVAVIMVDLNMPVSDELIDNIIAESLDKQVEEQNYMTTYKKKLKDLSQYECVEKENQHFGEEALATNLVKVENRLKKLEDCFLKNFNEMPVFKRDKMTDEVSMKSEKQSESIQVNECCQTKATTTTTTPDIEKVIHMINECQETMDSFRILQTAANRIKVDMEKFIGKCQQAYCEKMESIKQEIDADNSIDMSTDKSETPKHIVKIEKRIRSKVDQILDQIGDFCSRCTETPTLEGSNASESPTVKVQLAKCPIYVDPSPALQVPSLTNILRRQQREKQKTTNKPKSRNGENEDVRLEIIRQIRRISNLIDNTQPPRMKTAAKQHTPGGSQTVTADRATLKVESKSIKKVQKSCEAFRLKWEAAHKNWAGGANLTTTTTSEKSSGPEELGQKRKAQKKKVEIENDIAKKYPFDCLEKSSTTIILEKIDAYARNAVENKSKSKSRRKEKDSGNTRNQHEKQKNCQDIAKNTLTRKY